MEYLIWLTMVLGNTSATVWQFLKSYDSAGDAYREIVSGSCEIRLTDCQLKKIKENPLEKAQEIVSYCQKNDVSIIRYCDDGYPEQLKSMKYMPVILYYRGDISCIVNGKNITCVGTRNPCEYTVRTISRVCSELVTNGFTIVSGFAVGSDITSHLAAVNLNRPTICVLGCGIDVDYPLENTRYRKQILENGGVFISEYPPAQHICRGSFQRRNVILAALSNATIVFEAGAKSGSLNTAGSAVKQNKKLFCIPPADIFDQRYAGNIDILRNGAKPLYSLDDVYNVYNVQNAVQSNTLPDCIDVPSVKYPETRKCKTEKFIAVPVSKPVPEKSFTLVQQKILGLLENCTLHIDIIIQKMNMDISEIITELMELQFMGVVEELAGSRFRKC